MKIRKIVFGIAVILFAASSYAHAYIPTGLKWPTNVYTVVISGFGADWVKSCNGLVKKHAGIDLILSAGTPIYAAYGGVVRARGLSDPNSDWGQYVTISHNYGPYTDRWTSTYHHIDPVVNAGQYVSRGQLIGYVHATVAFHTHLHFGVRDASYSNTSNRGALPQTVCAGDPGFNEYFVDPYTLSYSP